MKKFLLFSVFLSLVAAMLPQAAAASPAAPPAAATAIEKAPPFDLNTVSLDELMSIRGIGPALAQRILDYRSRVGTIARIEDLLEVKGIGEKNLARFKEQLTLPPPPSPVAKNSPDSPP